MTAEDPEVPLAELLEEVRRIEVQSRRLVTDVMAGGYSSVFRGAGIEFDEVREYVPGDDPRTVDWNVTARVGRPYVKKYVDERQLTVLFLLDLSASMTGGYGAWSARQTAARLCACLALAAVRNDDKVGLVAFSREADLYVPPAKGMAHALRIVRDCLVRTGRDPGTGFASALEFVTRVQRRRAVVFLVSDFMDAGFESALDRCARHHDLIAVRLLAPELEMPQSGLHRIRDPETGAEAVMDWSASDVRDDYAARVAEWRDATTQALRRSKVDLIDIPVPREPDRNAIVRPILRFFRMREARGMKR